jgi:hypothetical protein
VQKKKKKKKSGGAGASPDGGASEDDLETKMSKLAAGVRVFMGGRGGGLVRDLNDDGETLIIDFDDGSCWTKCRMDRPGLELEDELEDDQA